VIEVSEIQGFADESFDLDISVSGGSLEVVEISEIQGFADESFDLDVTVSGGSLEVIQAVPIPI
jgi:hypothetical protein